MTSEPRILLLDGGMGTTLETLGHDVSSAVWGSELIESNPEAITSIHRGFIDAGADIIETATYQLTTEALLKSGHSFESAQNVLHQGVHLAYTAAAESSTRKQKSTKVALSLGPFGSTLSPGQEYTGFYPPPYGPQGFHQSESSSPIVLNTNIFDDNSVGKIKEREAEDGLMEFHLSRLRCYATDEKCWLQIDYIAFETVPLLREIRAIRRAMGILFSELGQTGNKPFWISSAYPGGRIGQQSRADPRAFAGVPEVMEALLGGVTTDSGQTVPTPDGLGINCTHPQFLSKLAQDYSAAYEKLLPTTPKPVSLVLYPDGGAVYDVTKRTWSSAEKIDPKEWARALWTVGEEMERVSRSKHEVGEGSHDQGRLWEKVVLGGCCKSGFEEIGALRHLIDHDRR